MSTRRTKNNQSHGSLIVDGCVVEIEQRGECEVCGKSLKQRQRGRERRFCCNKCRQASHRNTGTHFVTSPGQGTGALRNAQKIPTNSVASDPENQGRGSGFATPVNLVGGYRFPDARPIDPDLLAAILQTEDRLQPEDKHEPTTGDTVGPVSSEWEPSPNINPAGVPDIPDFLDRRPKTEADRADAPDESVQPSRRAA